MRKILIVALLFSVPVYAQHPGHRENHDWYRDLRQPGTGFSCCNGSANGVEGDCRPTDAELRDDGWYVLLEGGWKRVPNRSLLPMELNQKPFSHHVCAGKSGLIYCFLPGQPGG